MCMHTTHTHTYWAGPKLDSRNSVDGALGIIGMNATATSTDFRSACKHNIGKQFHFIFRGASKSIDCAPLPPSPDHIEDRSKPIAHHHNYIARIGSNGRVPEDLIEPHPGTTGTLGEEGRVRDSPQYAQPHTFSAAFYEYGASPQHQPPKTPTCILLDYSCSFRCA